MTEDFKKAIELEDLAKQYRKFLNTIKDKKISQRVYILDEDTGHELSMYVKQEFIVEMFKRAQADAEEEYKKIMQKIKMELR